MNLSSRKKTITSKFKQTFANLLKYLDNNVQMMNQSKIFAGIMIIILNIASKFVIIRLPQTVESYLKFTFSRDLLVFAIAWMGVRDIYISLGIVLTFIFIIDFLCNEKSPLCILPETFIDRHVEKLTEMNTLSPQDWQALTNLAKKIKDESPLEKNDESSYLIQNKGEPSHFM
jgi:hypothetical protein